MKALGQMCIAPATATTPAIICTCPSHPSVCCWGPWPCPRKRRGDGTSLRAARRAIRSCVSRCSPNERRQPSVPVEREVGARVRAAACNERLDASKMLTQVRVRDLGEQGTELGLESSGLGVLDSCRAVWIQTGEAGAERPTRLLNQSGQQVVHVWDGVEFSVPEVPQDQVDAHGRLVTRGVCTRTASDAVALATRAPLGRTSYAPFSPRLCESGRSNASGCSRERNTEASAPPISVTTIALDRTRVACRCRVGGNWP